MGTDFLFRHDSIWHTYIVDRRYSQIK